MSPVVVHLLLQNVLRFHNLSTTVLKSWLVYNQHSTVMLAVKLVQVSIPHQGLRL